MKLSLKNVAGRDEGLFPQKRVMNIYVRLMKIDFG